MFYGYSMNGELHLIDCVSKFLNVYFFELQHLILGKAKTLIRAALFYMTQKNELNFK